MKINLIEITILVIIVFVIIENVNAQTKVNETKSLSQNEKITAIDSISKLLVKNYVFPEVAVKMESQLKSNLKNKKYDLINSPEALADTLTRELQSVSKDKHLRVMYNPERVKNMKENNKSNDEEITPEFIQMMKNENYGFREVKRLSGNIGYIDFRNFGPGDLIKEKVASVMSFVEDCNALIFDMRYNGGGDPTGIQVITSYLFNEEPVHLNDLYFRPTDTTEQYWTLREIKGKRMPDVPVYVLTGKYSFSGAEEFTYNLKNLKRAVIVGETTGGGAHPGGVNIADDNFLVFVPVGRAINPITKTNWEGTGVIPDVEIKSTNALYKAQILALEKISEKNATEQEKMMYNFIKESLSKAIENSDKIQGNFQDYEGIYEDRVISFENGKLYYQRNGRQIFEMTPIGDDTFMFSDLEYFRIEFQKDETGKITGLKGIYAEGRTDYSAKTDK